MSEVKYVGKITDLPEAPGNFIENASKKVVFGPLHFWPDYVMRCFNLKPGAGEKEPHTHPWPHWVVIYDGEGVFCIDGVEYPVKRGDWVHVPGDHPHCFLCVVPPEGDVSPLLMGKGC